MRQASPWVQLADSLPYTAPLGENSINYPERDLDVSAEIWQSWRALTALYIGICESKMCLYYLQRLNEGFEPALPSRKGPSTCTWYASSKTRILHSPPLGSSSFVAASAFRSSNASWFIPGREQHEPSSWERRRARLYNVRLVFFTQGRQQRYYFTS